MNIASAHAAEVARAVRTGETSALAVAEAALARIALTQPLINAFTDVLAERARARAAALDTAIAAGRDPGPLAGVPFAVKNLFDIADRPTRAGSRINRELPPATRDAALIRRLEASGAVLVGGLNMGEYAYDFTGENAHDGASRNPHDLARMSGGSSGGSAAAVAAGVVPLALGSDTNGSIRVPASLCGIFGLKPTYGRLSRAGTFPFVDSLDHLGPLARSATDLGLAFDAMQGADPDDPACATRPPEPTLPALDQGIGGIRIAIAGDYFVRGGEPEAFAAVAVVAAALGATETITLPHANLARAAAYAITAIEGAQLHLPRLRNRAAEYDPDTRDRFLAGALLPAAWYVQAQRFRRYYRDNVLALFRNVDLILAPATPCVAPRIGQTMMTLDGIEMPVRANLGLFTQPISFIGLPVVTVPRQTASGLPIGVQIIARPFAEATALRAAAWLEQNQICAAPVAAGFAAKGMPA